MATTETIDQQLADLYYTADDPGSYGGVERLYKRARELNLPIDRAHVRRFLANQVTYQLHKPARHKYARNQTVVAHRDDQWQADLAVMMDIARANKGYRYILVCIDVLSRYAWAVPVRTKGATHILAAFDELLKAAAPRRPRRLQTDKGTEFHNVRVRKFLNDHGIELFATNSDHKAALAERFNRTMKTRIYKYLTAHNSRRYIDVLPNILRSYNHTYHRTIGCSPADIATNEDDRAVWRRVYYDSSNAQLRRSDTYPTNMDNVVGIGDRVRLSRWKGAFEKGYLPNWSREHYKITKTRAPRRGGMPRPVYNLEDMKTEEIQGLCYPEELQRVTDASADVLEVEKVLRSRRSATNANEQESLVKFKGWPHKFNRWITATELQTYKRSPLLQQQQLQP